MDRYESVMEGAAIWGAFYRANPDKICRRLSPYSVEIIPKNLADNDVLEHDICSDSMSWSGKDIPKCYLLRS